MAGPTREVELYAQAVTDATATVAVTVAGSREVDVYAAAVTDAGTPNPAVVDGARELDTRLLALTDAPTPPLPSVDPLHIADIYAAVLTNPTTLRYMATGDVDSRSLVQAVGGNFKTAQLVPVDSASAPRIIPRVRYQPGRPAVAELDELATGSSVAARAGDNDLVYAGLVPIDSASGVTVAVTGPTGVLLDPIDGTTGLALVLTNDYGVVLDPVDSVSFAALKSVPDLAAVIDGTPITLGLRARATLLILPAGEPADLVDETVNDELDLAAFGDASTRSDDDTPGTTGAPIYGVDG